MARRTQAQLQFDAISIEGGLLAPEWISRIATLEAPAQAPADYAVPKGLQLRDEIGRYWRIAGALWAELGAGRAQSHVPVEVTRRFVDQLLRQVLGFTDLGPGGTRRVGERDFPLAFQAGGGRVPVVVGAYDEALDDLAPRHGDLEHGVRRRSAWGALQEYLNAADDALWGIASNGLVLRVGRDNASLTRPAWIEVDLELVFTEERFADFSVLWLVSHATRFGRPGQPAAESPLEQWRTAGREEGSRAREQLRAGVEEALRALGQGFLEHSANTALRTALESGVLTKQQYFNELLRLVYRQIFLLTVEERGVLHPESPRDPEARSSHEAAVRLYADGYGMRRLRERSVRHSAHDRHGDLWAAQKPVFAALGSVAGEPALALPSLGGLFAADQCPHLDAASLENRRLLSAVFGLAWLREGNTIARVNWKDMGVEEFGSVYESLLELVPVIGADTRSFAFVADVAGNARKTSGSYYTPDTLVQQLLDTALEPVVADRIAARPEDPPGAILSVTVVDPACGSGHFLLAAARRLAGHLARVRAGGTPGAAEYRHALRDVVTYCIHGVDRNPMALELARMALWLEAYTPDRALGFLDHHLVCGDALLGLLNLGVLKEGIPDEAFNAHTGDDKEVARTLTKINRKARKEMEARARSGQFSLELGTQALAEAFATLDALRDEELAGVEAKRALYADLQAKTDASALALAADCFVGAFLVPKRVPDAAVRGTDAVLRQQFPTTATLELVLERTLSAEHPAVQTARRASADARVLHWPLAFPQVFARGGFDVVLGNPPWERIKLQEQEFFATRAPQVANARNKAEREREIAKLAAEPEGTPERTLYAEFVRSKQLAEAASMFCHAEVRYPLTGVGDVNTYALFAESMYRMTARNGRAGLIVPTGIATDDSTKSFFAELVSAERLVSLYDFENRELIFTQVYYRLKFCLLTIGACPAPEFTFYATQVEHLSDVRRRFRLTPSEFALINPVSRTCPVFRSAYDAELTKKIYRRVPVLWDDALDSGDANPWCVSFLRMFDMSGDSALFRTERNAGSLPLYEAKFIDQFDHRRGSYEARGNERGFRVLPETPLSRYQDPAYSIQPFYWVSADDVQSRVPADWTRRWFLGFKDVTSVTNARTVLATVIPLSAVGHTLPLVLSPLPAERLTALLANLNSLVLDYVARQKVGGLHLTYAYLKQLPILPPQSYSAADIAFVTERVLELTYTAADLCDWAASLNCKGAPFVWETARRELLRADLDAFYAHRYGLTRDELRYILAPGDVVGPDHPTETFRSLREEEERLFGEYRTRRLVLEAWDRLFGG